MNTHLLDETLAWLHNKKPLRSYVNIPPERATRVFSKEMQSYYEGFVYDSHKQSLFELINHTRFMPNSRIDSCSKALKRRKSQSWIKKNFKNPDDVSIYVGIGIWEEHRVKRAAKNWEPYQLSSPLVNYQVFEQDIEKEAFEVTGVNLPYLYQIGLSHNNCSGFCVKAGLSHYRQLLKEDRNLYLEHERNEELLYEKNSNLKPFLQSQVNKVRYYITLKQYRLYLEEGLPYWNGDVKPRDFDEMSGSCSCAI